MEAIDPFVFRLSIFVLAIFVGYFVVWSVTPALHTPLMSVTNAISSVIVVGALIAVSVPTSRLVPTSHSTVSLEANGLADVKVDGTIVTRVPPDQLKNMMVLVPGKRVPAPTSAWDSKFLGFFALILASVNIFGGFLVTARMLAMYKKKVK